MSSADLAPARSRPGASPLRVALRQVRRPGVGAVLASGVALVATLGTGVLLARALGPSGRGEATAALTAPQLIGWLFLLGSSQTISYFRAQEPERAPALLGTWLALSVPLAIAAVLTGQALLGTLLGAQSPEVLALARGFMVTAALVLVLETTLGFVLGAEHFGVFNLLRGGTPLATAAAYVLAWETGHLTVAFAVWATAAIQAVTVVLTLAMLVRRHGIARPDAALARRTLLYGLRAHGTNASFLLNARLDLLLLPAVVPAASLGLYSVATSVSWVVFALAGALAPLLLPVAARRHSDGEGPAVIVRGVRATLALAVALAGLLAVIAGPLITTVYGDDFARATGLVEALLPGTVLYAASTVLVSGLYAAGRPGLATLTQGLGLAVTVGGLSLLLGSGGINAAAWVSVASYLVVFAVAAASWCRVTDTPLRALVLGLGDRG